MKRVLSRLVPPVVTLALLMLLIRQLPRGELARLVASSSRGWLAAGFALYVIVNILRAKRFSLLLGQPHITTFGFLPVSFAVSLLNNVLPMRGGEVSFVVLARTNYRVPAAHGMAVLGLARLFDYLAVAVLFVPLATLALDRLPAATDWPVEDLPTAWLVAGVTAFVFLGAALAVSLAGLGERFVSALERLLRVLGLRQVPAAAGLLEFLRSTVASLAELRTRPTYLGAYSLSLVLWLTTFAWLYAFTLGVGREIGFQMFVVGSTFAVLSKALPLPTMGGLGVAEAGWTLGFTLVGWSVPEAIASGLAVTVLTLAASAVFGLAALLLLGLRGGESGTGART